MSSNEESRDHRRQRVEPSTLDVSRLRPSIVLGGISVDSAGSETTNDQDQAQDDALVQPRASEPDVLATVATPSTRDSECSVRTIGTLCSSFDSDTSSAHICSLAKELNQDELAAKRRRSRRDSRTSQESSSNSSFRDREAVVMGLSSRSLRTSKFASRTGSGTQMLSSETLALPGGIPLPQPLPEPTPSAVSRPGAYANDNVTPGPATRREREVDLEALSSLDMDQGEAEETAPAPLIEATLVIPGNSEDFEHPHESASRAEVPAVKAEQAGLTDLLQNRRLQYFLCGLVCCVSILVTGFVIALFAVSGGDEAGTMTEASEAGEEKGPLAPSNLNETGFVEALQQIAQGIEDGVIFEDDFWTNSDGDRIDTSDDDDDDDDSVPEVPLITTHHALFRQYLVFDRQPQWNDTVRTSYQATLTAFLKDAMLEALDSFSTERNSLNGDQLKEFISNSTDIECRIVNERTAPIQRFRLDGGRRQALSQYEPLSDNYFNHSIWSTDLWETDVMYELKWPSALGELSSEMEHFFSMYMEGMAEQLADAISALWGAGAVRSVSPPVALNAAEQAGVLAGIVDDDGADVVGESVVGHYRQRFIMGSNRPGGETANKAIFESIMEIYSLNLLRDVIPTIPEYAALDVNDIQTECDVQVTSSSDFPAEDPSLSEGLQVQFVSYTIWWTWQDWAEPVNTSNLQFTELYLEHVNSLLPDLTSNLVNARLNVLQSRPAAIVDPSHGAE